MPCKDKKSQAESARKHYLKNKKVIKAKAANFKSETAIPRNKKFVREYLLKHPCIDCGESDPIVLEFDHVRGIKKGNISNMVNQAYSIKRIKQEIEKCEVRCANCHRRITFYRRIEQSGSSSVS